MYSLSVAKPRRFARGFTIGSQYGNTPSLSSSQGQIRELFILTVAERQGVEAIPAERGLVLAHALTFLSRSWYARRVSNSRA